MAVEGKCGDSGGGEKSEVRQQKLHEGVEVDGEAGLEEVILLEKRQKPNYIFFDGI